jgi:hypothetical protein
MYAYNSPTKPVILDEISYGDIWSIFRASAISNMAMVQIFRVMYDNFQIVCIEQYAQ